MRKLFLVAGFIMTFSAVSNAEQQSLEERLTTYIKGSGLDLNLDKAAKFAQIDIDMRADCLYELQMMHASLPGHHNELLKSMLGKSSPCEVFLVGKSLHKKIMADSNR